MKRLQLKKRNKLGGKITWYPNLFIWRSGIYHISLLDQYLNQGTSRQTGHRGMERIEKIASIILYSCPVHSCIHSINICCALVSTSENYRCI